MWCWPFLSLHTDVTAVYFSLDYCQLTLIQQWLGAFGVLYCCIWHGSGVVNTQKSVKCIILKCAIAKINSFLFLLCIFICIIFLYCEWNRFTFTGMLKSHPTYGALLKNFGMLCLCYNSGMVWVWLSTMINWDLQWNPCWLWPSPMPYQLTHFCICICHWFVEKIFVCNMQSFVRPAFLSKFCTLYLRFWFIFFHLEW